MAVEQPVMLRGLFAEMAVLMQATMTFKAIADRFYAVGVIDAPESPYGDYSGSKRDYVMERLHLATEEGKDLDAFLRTTVPEVVIKADIEGINTKRAEWLMENLGYYLDPEDDGVKHGLADYTAPETFPFATKQELGTTTARRLDIPGLPGAIQELIDELEDCLARGNRNAAALLTRKIIHQAVFIAMQRQQKEHVLKRPDGDDVELSIALARCGQELGITSQVMARVKSAKWIGDTANHSYRAKVTDGDLETATTALSLFLREIL